MNFAEPLPLTKKVAEYIADANFKKIPSGVVKTIKDSVIDTVGCGILGSTTPFAKLFIDFIDEWKSVGESVVWGTNKKASIPFAAMANCASALAWDFDDTVLPAMIHPGNVTIPTALSVAEKRGGINGREFLTAITLSYEVGNLIGTALGALNFISTGFYNSVPIIFASAITAGKLMDLGEEELQRAFGIAATQAAGLYSVTQARRINAPKAVMGGIFAAELAKRGLTAPKDTLEADSFGFLKTFSDTPQMDVIPREIGHYAFEVFHKYYPCKRSNHPAAENVRIMMNEHPDLKPDRINKIIVSVDKTTLEYKIGSTVVKTVENALFSLPFCVAAMIVDGELTLDQFTEEKVRNPAIQELLKKVELVVDPEIDKLPAAQRYRCTVEIKLENGTSYKRFLAGPKGDPTNRMTKEEMYRKFMKNATKVIERDKMEELFNTLQNLEELDDVSQIAEFLSI